MTTGLAVIEPRSASPAELRAYAITIRQVIPSLTKSQLHDLEVLLSAVARRLRQIGHDASEAEATRALALQRIGNLLGPAETGRPKASEVTSFPLSQAEMDRRAVARLLAEQPEAVALTLAAPGVTLNKAITAARQARRRAQFAASPGADLAAEARRFPVLYADPPWQYEGAETDSRKIENQYPTMTLPAIKALPVPAADDAVLFLWATSPKLIEALAVMTAWGFTYRTCMVWVKDKIGMGYYARQRHELLLIGKRGGLPPPAPATRPDSVISAPRGEHSAKPGIFRELIEAMYPGYGYCELFLRGQPCPGWHGWGYEVET